MLEGGKCLWIDHYGNWFRQFAVCASLECRLCHYCGVNLSVVWVEIGSAYALIPVCIPVLEHYVGESGGVKVAYGVSSILKFRLGCIYKYRTHISECIDVFDDRGSAVLFIVR